MKILNMILINVAYVLLTVTLLLATIVAMYFFGAVAL